MFVTVRNGPDDAPQPMAVPLSHFSAPPGMAVAQHGPARRVVVAQPPFATQAAYANPNDTMKTLDERFRALSAQRSQSVRRAEAKARQAEARQSALAAQRKVSSAAAPSAPPSASARAGGKQTGGGGSTRPSSTAANGSKSRSKPAAATSSAKKPAAAAAVPATPPIQSRLTFPGGAGAVKGKAGAAGGATGAGSLRGGGGVRAGGEQRELAGGELFAGRRGGAVVAAAGVRTRATAARTAFGATMFGLGPRGGRLLSMSTDAAAAKPDEVTVGTTAGDESAPLKKSRKILVAVDPSDESSYALKWALENVIQAEDKVHLLHAQPYPKVYAGPAGPGLVPRVFQTWQSLEDGTPVVHARCARFCVPSEVVETMKKQYSRFYVPPEVVETMKKQEEAVSRQVLRAAKAMCEQFKVSAEADVIEGEPRESICDCRGAAGRAAAWAFLGSVSDYCVDTAACPNLPFPLPFPPPSPLPPLPPHTRAFLVQ
ncbi:unnamed protein product, partial [Closterium sp. NIES-65]